MGRSGITYEDVLRAASEITGEGLNPTVDGVRERLGTGSKSTIAPLLKQWKLEQQGVIAMASKKGMPEALTAAVYDLYHKIQAEADAKLDEVTIRFEEELATTKDALERVTQRESEMEKLYLESQSNLNQLHQSFEKAQSGLRDTQEENRLLRSKLTQTEQWLSDKQEEIKEHRTIIQRAQENFNHYQSKVQDQREQERVRYDSEVSKIRATMYDIQSELQQIQNENQALSDQLEALGRTNELLTHQNNEKDYELEKHQIHLGELKSINKQLEGQLYVTRQQLDDGQLELKEERTIRNQLDRKLAISEHQASSLNTENQRLRDKLTAASKKPDKE